MAPEKLSPLQAGRLGEQLAVAKLNTLGFPAYISPEGAPGHDLVVIVEGQARQIEVKTRQYRRLASEIGRWPVDMVKKAGADFFVFVELNLQTLMPTFYVLTNAEAQGVHKDYNRSGNCPPARVRELARPNDFSKLTQ